ncbi:SAM-dependent methyltransferase [Mytilinidion resinicola]|uniref:SAM-dependent methyltransferase n=1 Tax=Mytilinidion resinicola TaxID=574789 RepID=A0A6A6Y4U6_9PEZI|nr:SAM-dependent methyltransferase [Mytilinidion resinicola]KAF2803812.1 SAM-dependent methyltransferase [Mytilinidion resinicola]
MSSSGPLSPSLAPQIASACIHTSPLSDVQAPQTLHRIALLNTWFPSGVRPGTRILELGCGQGDTTAALAHLVGPTGHVTALDPAPLDYGAPVTLGEAQSHLSKGVYGDRITWVQAEVVEWPEALEGLKKGGKGEEEGFVFDAVVLAHSIWYMAGRDVLGKIFEGLRGKTGRVCVAEWSLQASVPSQFPHVFAALTRAALEAQRTGSEENIQSPLAPVAIKEVAEASGWRVGSESVITPGEGMMDGEWELGTVRAEGFFGDVERDVGDGRVREVVLSLRTAMMGALRAAGKEGVRSMDVWVADFA